MAYSQFDWKFIVALLAGIIAGCLSGIWISSMYFHREWLEVLMIVCSLGLSTLFCMLANVSAAGLFKEELGRRPIVVQIACALGFFVVIPLLAAFIIPGSRDSLVDKIGSVGALIGLLSLMVYIIAACGLWRMRRWGVYLWAAPVVLTMLYDLLVDGLDAFVAFHHPFFVVQFVVTILLFGCLDQMS